MHSISVRERVGRESMLIRISDPDLLADLCDSLSREGFAFSAVQPGQDWVHVLAAGAETDLTAASLLLLKADPLDGETRARDRLDRRAPRLACGRACAGSARGNAYSGSFLPGR